MQPQLEAPESQRTDHNFTVTLFRFVVRFDVRDAEWWLRVAVDKEFKRWIILPILFSEQPDAVSACREDDMHALDYRRGGFVVQRLDRSWRKAEAMFDGPARGLRALI